jgi:hypothetical protein
MRVKMPVLSALVLAAVCGSAMTVAVQSASALAEGLSPADECDGERASNEVVEQHTMLLAPPDGSVVPAGTIVSFSGESGFNSPLTFVVASSPALLSTPDIDSGAGSEQGGIYTFSSARAAATPGRTIYWAATFTRTLKGCEGPPVTFTTTPRTLTVLPPPPPGGAPQEKGAASGPGIQLNTGRLSLDGATIKVHGPRGAAVKLTCTGTAACDARLLLTVKRSIVSAGKARAKTRTIGGVGVSIAANRTTTVDFALSTAGRELLGGAHGHLNASLTIIKTSPAPTSTQTRTVRLVLG